MFEKSAFDGDISRWDVSKVQDMRFMFAHSRFKQDISMWCPVNIAEIERVFVRSIVPIPYWGKIVDKQERHRAIEVYQCKKELEKNIDNNLLRKKSFKV